MESATAILDAVSKDRHKPSRMCRIRGRLATQAKKLGDKLEHDFTQVVNDALREKLEREGLWPPPERAKKPRKPADSD